MSRQHTEELRQKYIQNPPEGITADEIRTMSEEDLLDMNYFLNEEDFDYGEAGEEGFYIFWSSSSSLCARLPAGCFHSEVLWMENFPIKQK